MAYKSPQPESNRFTLTLEHIEMLKVERLLKRLETVDNGNGELLDSEENKWLSNALDFFAPELPPGEYPI